MTPDTYSGIAVGLVMGCVLGALTTPLVILALWIHAKIEIWAERKKGIHE